MRVLHVLSQRPLRTGSGVTLDALVRQASAAGHEQAAIVGTPWDDPDPPVADLPSDAVHPLLFGQVACDFLLPGMSDVMPYPSSRFSELTDEQLVAYRGAWQAHVAPILASYRPDVIHAHHVWLLSSLVCRAAGSVPVVIHGHATGLRQMELCPHLVDEVRSGCALARHVVALHGLHADQIRVALGVPGRRVTVVGAGYRDDLFVPESVGDERDPNAILYAGKYSSAKGLPQLLDAFESVADERPAATLHVVGEGAGDEAERLRTRMRSMPRVVLHGSVPQSRLAALMRRAHAFALPSFYEGLPLVLVEAYASGCRVVATDLPVVSDELAPVLGDALHAVDVPELLAVDRPRPAGLPRFVSELAGALRDALDAPPVRPDSALLARFGWPAVFERVEAVWRQVTGG